MKKHKYYKLKKFICYTSYGLASLLASFSSAFAHNVETDQSIQKLPSVYEDKIVLGSQEWVYINKIDTYVRARIDTGASASSVSAINVETYKKDGEDWVKFNLAHDGKTSKKMHAPVARWAHIRQASSPDGIKRPIINAKISIGKKTYKTEFSLNDRTHMQFGILLGRSFFDEKALVDVSQKYIQPKFKPQENDEK